MFTSMLALVYYLKHVSLCKSSPTVDLKPILQDHKSLEILVLKILADGHTTQKVHFIGYG